MLGVMDRTLYLKIPDALKFPQKGKEEDHQILLASALDDFKKKRFTSIFSGAGSQWFRDVYLKSTRIPHSFVLIDPFIENVSPICDENPANEIRIGCTIRPCAGYSLHNMLVSEPLNFRLTGSIYRSKIDGQITSVIFRHIVVSNGLDVEKI